jgi:alginate O-acetyltransferase complex protein AlgI
LAAGAQRIALGLFLKVGLADNIAPMVDAGFAAPVELLTALDVWTLAFLFGFQIYFDFSAYSSIAIGCARMMGIHFPENFNFPYFATSARDFWRRWHISLSSWIRDYLYLPLTGVEVREAGSKGGLAVASRHRRDGALLLTWAIMGLWHGARWTFVLWGVYHALWVLLGRWAAPITDRLPQLMRRTLAWPISLAIAMLGWLPFRMETVPDTLRAFQTLLTPEAYTRLGLRENTYLVAALLMVAMVICYLVHTRVLPVLNQRPKLLRPLAAAFFGVVVFVDFVYLRPISQFIYFQF